MIGKEIKRRNLSMVAICDNHETKSLYENIDYPLEMNC